MYAMQQCVLDLRLIRRLKNAEIVLYDAERQVAEYMAKLGIEIPFVIFCSVCKTVNLLL